MDDDVAQFLNFTGTDDDRVARGYLDISGGEITQAVQLFFESPELAASFRGPAAPSAPTSTARGTTSSTGREDARGVIHIDSDEDDVLMGQGDDDNLNNNDGDDEDGAAAAIRAAQEAEDAAMAQRLQDDMYSQDPASADGVRAPMDLRRTETLVGGDPVWGLQEDREAAVLEQLRRRRQAPGPAGSSRNPFAQSIWDAEAPSLHGTGAPPVPSGTRPGGPAAPAVSSRSQRLGEMFRPPYEMMAAGLTWDDTRQSGKEEKKWILVNVQDMTIFQCQVLNRDHWKDEKIRALIKEHFLFLQYDKDQANNVEYINLYFGQGYEDSNNYPYLSVIDPRTGEQVKTWSGLPFPTPQELYSDLAEFLDRYSLAANSKNPVPKSKPQPKKFVDPDRMTEEEQLEMALKNSLEANGGSSGQSIEDPDKLTKGKGKEATVEETVADQPTSLFSQISSNQPHTEPDPDPATSTRIQFRHPAGRVIRRFAVSDPVRRIYEWLKAEPFEGKEGVNFELKTNPGGDLIDKLDSSIEATGLKQGTVMVEFVEDE